jgi:hypothetical protein
MNNKQVIMNYYINNFIKLNYKKNIIKNGKSIQDIFQDRILELLETNKKLDNSFNIENYVKQERRERLRLLKMEKQYTDNYFILEEKKEDDMIYNKIELLFIDYQPEPFKNK